MPECKKCGTEIQDDFRFCPYCGQNQSKPIRQRHTLKRENGIGSVYKRSDLKSRPWIATTPATDSEPRKVIGHYESAQLAKDALEDYRRNPTTKLNITLSEIYEEWQPLGTKGKSKQLIGSYRAAYGKLSILYNKKFRELRTAQFQKIIEDLQDERPKLDKKGKAVVKDGKTVMLQPMSYSALHDIKVLVGLLYKYALQNDIVNKNYAEFLVLPEKNVSSKERFTDLELAEIEKHVGKVPFADCILMMCYTGFRINEFLTLTKFSIHTAGNITLLVGGEKTEAGKDRPIPVHKKIKPYLDIWLAKGGETIICRDDGRPYSPNYFRKYCFSPALKQMGIRPLTPHATRRTFSTRASASGMRPEDIIALMGHTDFSVDIDSYINQTAETLSQAIEKLP